MNTLSPSPAAGRETQTRALLQVENVHTGFGSNAVLHGPSFEVRQGQTVGIFGLNGAGKSVLMKVIAGVVPLWSGRLVFEGVDITKMSAEQRVAHGMGHVPQGRQVFPGLTVEENLRLGAYTLRRRAKQRYAGALDGVFDRFPVLAERRGQLAGSLSGGQQASLAVARALINEPKLVLVDEASAGLAPVAVRELFKTLRDVVASGVTLLMVEQNVSFGLQLVDEVNILQMGRIVYSGDVATLDREALVRFLGIGRMLGKGTAGALAGRQGAEGKNDKSLKRPGQTKSGKPAGKTAGTTAKTSNPRKRPPAGSGRQE
ncbi:MAG: ABC transporter ATP-binding protein [Actinomycetota bacterium]